jgi:hypothetical protein
VEIGILEIKEGTYIYFLKDMLIEYQGQQFHQTKVMSLLGRKIRKRSGRVKINIQEFLI